MNKWVTDGFICIWRGVLGVMDGFDKMKGDG